MNLKQYAELNEITLADAKKRTGLTHWAQAVPDAPAMLVEEQDKEIDALSSVEASVVEEVKEVVTSAKDLLKESQDVMKVLMRDSMTAENALIGIKMIGEKSKYYPFIKVLQTLVD
jgi:hypothetical protein